MSQNEALRSSDLQRITTKHCRAEKFHISDHTNDSGGTRDALSSCSIGSSSVFRAWRMKTQGSESLLGQSSGPCSRRLS